jgi:hypothetical protein
MVRSELAHVDRAQPKAPAGELEQTAKASKTVDAGHGDEGHLEARKGHDSDGGEVVVAVGKVASDREAG